MVVNTHYGGWLFLTLIPHPSCMADHDQVLAARFGEHVRRLRRGAGLSQEDLADESGLHTNYIGMVERGERRVTVDAARRIAAAFGVKLSQLLAANGRMTRRRRPVLRARLVSPAVMSPRVLPLFGRPFFLRRSALYFAHAY